MSDAFEGLGKLVPGFDFLQSLMKNSQAAMPGFGQWVAPTLDPAELDKRINELRAVQFWLEQNGRMLGTTIQAMEVQRMTLSTLQGMNVPLDALREAMTVRPPVAAAAPAPSPFAWPSAAPAAPAAARPAPGAPDVAPPASAGEPPAAPPLVDPMQWWGALSQQFSTLAAQALQDPGTQAAAQAATRFAGDLMKQSFSTAEEALRQGLSAAQPPAPAAPARAARTDAAPEAARKPPAARKSAAAKTANPRTPRTR